MRCPATPLLAALLGLGLAAGPLLATAPPAAAAPQTFTVNTTDDADDGRCDPFLPLIADCTLREAINAANAHRGADTIAFAIPGDGVRTIRPDSALPTITDPVTIDGYAQPGARPNTKGGSTNALLLIELDGGEAGDVASGLEIATDRCTVRGLVINRFGGRGIRIVGAGNTVAGNFIGTDPSGTRDLGNGNDGVASQVGANTIGGTEPAARNLIAGNGNNGVLIQANGTVVQGNLIGTSSSGVGALGNDRAGVALSGRGNTIGGTAVGAANAIAFSGEAGVDLFGDATTGNRILGNRIFGNAELGIDLGPDGPTANDPRDKDGGQNRLQNAPVVSAATVADAGTTTISGTLASTPSARFVVQFFGNPADDPDEGKTFVGQRQVKTNKKGRARFTFATDAAIVAVGETITATATNKQTKDTSEFSAAVAVVAAERTGPAAPATEAATAGGAKGDDGKRRARPGGDSAPGPDAGGGKGGTRDRDGKDEADGGQGAWPGPHPRPAPRGGKR